jgi:uncharacterized coiled-coil DUF342 family protein
VEKTSVAEPEEAKEKVHSPSDQNATTKSNEGKQIRHPERDGRPSLGEVVRNSNNPEAKKLKEEIDSLRRKRDKLVADMHASRRSLNYKNDEYAALAKFLQNESNKPNQSEIIRLKKMKNRLEFRLSTEPRMSLETERDLIRKIDEVGKELREMLRYSGLERKQKLLKGDIERYASRIEEIAKELDKMNNSFDTMYAELKKTLGISTMEQRHGQQRPRQISQEKRKQPPTQEINLEDIVVIKRKPDKNAKKEGPEE